MVSKMMFQVAIFTACVVVRLLLLNSLIELKGNMLIGSENLIKLMILAEQCLFQMMETLRVNFRILKNVNLGKILPASLLLLLQ